MASVVILQGSVSDDPIGDGALKVLRGLGVPCHRRICSAHRTPLRLPQLLEEEERDGAQVFIAIAGLAAHLAGAVAAHSLVPVIGVPGDGGPMQGTDALLSTVQMPPGVPVATVGIGNGANAGWLAARILALSDQGLAAKLREVRADKVQELTELDAKARGQG